MTQDKNIYLFYPKKRKSGTCISFKVIEIFTTAIQALCVAFSSFSRLRYPIYFALYSVYIFTFAVSISFLFLTNNLVA